MRRLTAVGLRTRLLAAMVAVAAATLLAAALALLPSLQTQLQRQAENNLAATTLSARPSIERALRPTTERERADDPHLAAPRPDIFALQEAAVSLSNQIDGRVAIVDRVNTSPPLYDTQNGSRLPLQPIYRSIIDQDTAKSEVGDTAVVAAPLYYRGSQIGVLVSQKRLTDVAATTRQVRTAFVTAALVGLTTALVLASGLATTLARRLKRLQSAAVRITAGGADAPAPALDDGHDEVGDLARALTAMHAALRRQEKARRAFVATASHELRTPLTSLGWALEMLHDDLQARHLDVDDARVQVVGAQAQLARLQRLAAELLDLSRLDADVELRAEPVDLGELARAVAAEFEKRAGDAGVDLDVTTPPGPCWGRGDPGALAQVVRILLDNALRFAPRGSTVRVVPAYHGDAATVAVEDEGPGVPTEEAERIFERFERGSRTGGEGGFGLGLAIGRELARKQGGELTLRPPGPGERGARFVLQLPIELPSGTHAPGERAAGAGAPVRAS